MKCLQSLQINVQELHDDRTRENRVMTVIKSGDYAEKIAEIITHLDNMFTSIMVSTR